MINQTIIATLVADFEKELEGKTTVAHVDDQDVAATCHNGNRRIRGVPKQFGNPTTPSAPLLWLRPFFLMAQGPLLYEEPVQVMANLL